MSFSCGTLIMFRYFLQEDVMRIIKILVLVSVLSLPFFIGPEVSALDSSASYAGWFREDTKCVDYKRCEKTNCTAGGQEQCKAQYCNLINCGSEDPLTR